MTEIGAVQLNYNEDGTLSAATFTPSIVLKSENDLIERLNNVKSAEEPDAILQQAQRVFSTWFNLMTDIELSEDREIVSSINYGSCEKYESGIVKNCKIIFSYN